MEIKWLKTFIIAASYENFRQASEDLFLTQPAVSKHIQRLQQELGAEFFEKKGKYITLTEAGRFFLPHAQKMVRAYEEGVGNFKLWKQGYNRKLTISAAPQIAASVLPSLIKQFVERYPHIEVTVNITNSFQVGKDISDRKSDVGLTRMLPGQADVFYELIHKEKAVLVAPFSAEARTEQELLSSYRLLTNNHPVYWEDLLLQIKACYPHIQLLPVTQVEITKRFIEEGLGVSYLPFSMVKKEVENQTLSVISQQKIIRPSSHTYIVTKGETEETKQFKHFVAETLTETS
ncbi:MULTISPECIES: LysR family transcriptional regulator [Priestia]|uniref:LysR family transcriptional regulator n=1 Tax=Priestia TaxID=2800373 RepID=UPI001C8DB23D|nr:MULTISPECIES: LysR family transcriptional regulator [Priestia]MBX9995468.1 LysR family transcriptional regulator [Priestia aryabhattai]